MTAAQTPAPANGRTRPPTQGQQLTEALNKKVQSVEELLPPAMKGQADRLVKRAVLYFYRKPDLMECTVPSFVRCVLDAAELGLAVDGRLGHAVAFNNKVKGPDGKDRWYVEAQFMPDYKGLVAVARRCSLVKDVYADVVCKGDHFRHGRSGAGSVLEHSWELGLPRGEVVGAYAVLVRPDGSWRYDLMDLAAINRIKARSKSGSKGKGPWATDEDEMRKKTVLRRLLKTYQDDPGLAKALEADDRDFEDDAPAREAAGTPPVGKVSLRAGALAQTLEEGPGEPTAEAPGELPPDEDRPAREIGDEPEEEGGQ